MIFGVMSDTHGNRALMHRVAEWLVQEAGADLIYHLGDDYSDFLELRDSGYPIRGVPGLWCKEYHQPNVPKVLVEDIEGVTVACAHADQDLRGAAAQARLILSGHTHQAAIRRRNKTIRLNPGHLKAELSRGERASFAVVHIDRDKIRLSIHELDGSVRMEKEVKEAIAK
ncbi:MAG TPA: metallophosphoesterase family protein [Candidatus Hydrogenedentes bacterium]|nr:metallophosphoesterase family protein [Candidatus Hydrogenedentota bacterium]